MLPENRTPRSHCDTHAAAQSIGPHRFQSDPIERIHSFGGEQRAGSRPLIPARDAHALRGCSVSDLSLISAPH